MSSIRTAFTTVRNFFVSFVGQQEESSEEVNSYSSRFARGIFSGAANRKRSAQSIYEPEITDDEDDPGFPNYPSQHNLGSKRLRVDSDVEFEMSSRKRSQQTSSRYVTRGSGVPPTIEGLSKQPWEFQFPSCKSTGPQRSAPDSSKDGAGSSYIWSRYKPMDDRMNKANFGEQLLRSDAPGTTSSGPRNLRYNPVTLNKNVEAITLDDNEDNPCASTSSAKQATSSLAPGRNEAALLKPRVSSTMKGSKNRDSNRFSRYLGDIGRKIVGTTHSTAVRLQEKHRYKQLLMAYNVLNSKGIYETSALTKSRVNEQQLQVLYNKFGTSPTGGAVTFRVNGRSLTTDISSRPELLSAADASALVPVPRLFSTPTETDSFLPSPRAIKNERGPEVIDLEKEPSSSDKSEQLVSPITPVTSRRNLVLSPPLNLEDALNNSAILDEAAASGHNISEGSVFALEGSPIEEEEEDISIIAEKIVNKSRSKSVNTLALEQTLCPYTETGWLVKSRSSRIENQKYREMRIREEEETMAILKRESTLAKDLGDKIRKKLTLTEIIVLEEPPLELPELTPEMKAVIDYARSIGYDSEVLAEVRLPKDTIKITRGDIKTLGAMQWLNDNVINTYLGLIVLRSKQDNHPSVYAFQTFFYPKLMKEGYSNSLKRWTRKDDIFAHDLIILPIHLGLHWCLACVDLRKKVISYYDSLGGDNNKCLHSLLDYISSEMKERRRIDLNRSEWSLQNVKGIPQQENGSDCGMFSCKFAEYLSRDAALTFKQEDMPYYRDRMVFELIKSDLLYP